MRVSEKNRELVLYLVCGVATTVVNYIIYFAGTKWLSIDYLASNVAACVISVISAFLLNKVLVFVSHDWEIKTLVRQIIQFVSARVFSLVVETAMLWGFVQLLGFDDSIIKIVAGIVVIILNYIFSKWIIFKKERK